MQLTEQQNGPEHFDASPVVTVDVLGKTLSITRAIAISEALAVHVKALLLPADDWRWLEGRLIEPGDGDEFERVRGRVVPSGSLLACYTNYGPVAQRVGLTNDLNDAKWMVAEAIRVRRAGQNVEDPPGVG